MASASREASAELIVRGTLSAKVTYRRDCRAERWHLDLTVRHSRPWGARVSFERTQEAGRMSPSACSAGASRWGLPHEQVTVGVSGREAHGGVHDGLVFDGGQSAQPGLSTTPVVGPLDPGDDRDPEFFSGPPPLTIRTFFES